MWNARIVSPLRSTPQPATIVLVHNVKGQIISRSVVKVKGQGDNVKKKRDFQGLYTVCSLLHAVQMPWFYCALSQS